MNTRPRPVLQELLDMADDALKLGDPLARLHAATGLRDRLDSLIGNGAGVLEVPLMKIGYRPEDVGATEDRYAPDALFMTVVGRDPWDARLHYNQQLVPRMLIENAKDEDKCLDHIKVAATRVVGRHFMEEWEERVVIEDKRGEWI